MAAAKRKEKNILAGLASVVGLDADASAAEVLQTVAETLGCVVAEDGTTELAEEEPAQGKRKRRRGAAANGSKRAAAEEEAAEEEDEEDEEEEDEEGSEEEEEGGSEEGAPSPTSSGQPGEGEGEGEDEMEDFDLTLEPVEVEDPRSADMVAPWSSLADGEAVFQWLISPVDTATFWEGLHEDAPLLVARPANRAYFGGLFSKGEIDKLLRRPGGLQYMYNVDVTSFSAGGRQRTNLNFNGDAQPEAEAAPETADPEVVWRRFGEGCSVRVLHPQRFCDGLWRLVARLESYLQCPVGCNSYLTPPGTQGFAPHWDDIDAFVLQLEGSKRWRVHAPTEPQHVLPRYSSRDFNDDELGEVVMEVVLQPGDLLYLPRGVVHQAEALPDGHSLHITLSANQQRSWAVFLEEALPQALREAAQASRDLRRSLPRDFLEYMGMVHAREAGEEEEDEEDPRRAEFTRTCADLVEAVMHHMPLDEVADQMAVQFLQQRLPPPPREGAAKPKGGAEAAGGSGGLGTGAWVGLAQPGIARLVIDEEGPEPIAEVHHCCANRRDLHARKPADEQEALDEALEEVAVEAAGSLEFPLAAAELLDVLLRAGSGAPGAPEAVPVADLPAPVGGDAPSVESVVRSLLEAGVLELKDAPAQEDDEGAPQE